MATTRNEKPSADKRLFALHLKEIMEAHGDTIYTVAEDLGLSPATISRYTTGAVFPKDPTINALLNKYRDVNAMWLLGLPGYEKHDPPTKYISQPNYLVSAQPAFTTKKIPVLGRIAAGIPLTATENILDFEEITAEMASLGEHFGLQVRGTSMAPRIVDGDVVIIRKQSDIDSGDVAAVFINGEDATLKKVIKTEAGIMLQSFNQAYEPTFYSNEEIKKLPVEILGKAVELRGKF